MTYQQAQQFKSALHMKRVLGWVPGEDSSFVVKPETTLEHFITFLRTYLHRNGDVLIGQQDGCSFSTKDGFLSTLILHLRGIKERNGNLALGMQGAVSLYAMRPMTVCLEAVTR